MNCIAACAMNTRNLSLYFCTSTHNIVYKYIDLIAPPN